MANKSVSYTVDYSAPEFKKVEEEGAAELSKLKTTYDDMISQTDSFYNNQMSAMDEWAEKRSQIQNEQTDFSIEQIEQQKEQAKKDYTKEQSGAYVDWQKQSNEYGANAEQMAAQGMTGTGYSESSQVSMYNTYQNRVATAREAFSRAVLNYDNAIKDARLQNNAALAEIAFETMQTKLELALEGFQYKNTLIMSKTEAVQNLKDNYYNRYLDVLNQINTENALAEEVRQYNESLAEEKRQYNSTLALQKEELALQKSKFAYQKAQDAAAKAAQAAVRSETVEERKARNRNKHKGGQSYTPKAKETKETKNTTSGKEYLEALIASGGNKQDVAVAISLAYHKGEISKKEYQELNKTFLPRGIQY